MASFAVIRKIKNIFGIKRKKTNLMSFNHGYSQGFSNKGFADNPNLFPYDKISSIVRLYVIGIEKAVREHYKKKYNSQMARSKAIVTMSHYGIDRLAKKVEKYGGAETVRQLEEEVKTMYEELGIQSQFKNLSEFSYSTDQ